MAETRKIDAVTTEIIRNGMVAATEEMKSNLMRTAYNMIIYEALDFTVGIFDRAGNTVSIGIGLPMFIRGMSNTVKRMIAHFGYDQIEDGDVLLTNDAYITGSHLNHMTFVVPVFAVVYGALFLGEVVTPWMLFCGAIIICGTALSANLIRLR